MLSKNEKENILLYSLIFAAVSQAAYLCHCYKAKRWFPQIYR